MAIATFRQTAVANVPFNPLPKKLKDEKDNICTSRRTDSHELR